ncbi:MAG: PhnD/SsuA/transferrin family substrate-binding protein [Pseudomonadota bacterium]
MTTVGLPMYDFPELRPATDHFWQGLARAFRKAGVEAVPDALDRTPSNDNPLARPDLLFSQTCGYPLMTELAGVVQLVATPRYDVPGCEGPYYSSAIVARVDDPATALSDFRDRVVAYNGTNSQSGYNTLRHSLAPLAGAACFFAQAIETGAHLASLEAVASGAADLAAVDCVSFALLSRAGYEAAARCKVVAWSAPAASLPYVTRAGADRDLVKRLRDGLTEAFADLSLDEARAALCLKGFDVLEPSAYQPICQMEQEAIAQGYPRIA